MSRRVLVTGAAGRLGALVVDALREAGWTTRALVHRRPVDGADEQVAGDLADAASLERAAAGVDAVMHLAAVTHARRAEDYFAANLEGTRRLLAACAAVPGRFVFVSSRAATADGGAYAVSKLQAEQAVAGRDGPWAIVRLPEVYGTGGAEGVDDIIARAAAGRRIPVVGDGSDELRPILVDDAVVALRNALDADGVHTLAGERTTVAGFAEAATQVFGSSSRLLRVPRAAVNAGAALGRVLPLPLYPDQPARLRAAKPDPTPPEALGVELRSLQDGLALVRSRPSAAERRSS